MIGASIPAKMPVVWASGANPANIRAIPVTTGNPIAASYTLGWPSGVLSNAGSPPSGLDDNGINNAITAWLQWVQAGGPILYDATFQTAIGGYPIGAILQRADGTGLWRSTVDNNMTDPDTGGAGWANLITNITGNAATATNVNTANVAVTLGADWKIDAQGQLANNANTLHCAVFSNTAGVSSGTLVPFNSISQQGTNFSIFSTGTIAVTNAGLYEIEVAFPVVNVSAGTTGIQTINVSSGTLISAPIYQDYGTQINYVVLYGLWEASAGGHLNITSSVAYTSGGLTIAAARCVMKITRRG